VSLATGYVIGRVTASPPQQQQQLLPSGLPRTCCDDKDESPLTQAQQDLIGLLKNIVGESNVLQGSSSFPYCKGMRVGQGGGQALCVVTPRLLHDVVKCLPLIVEAGCTIVVQGANTGLTGGSVPRDYSNDDDARPTVLISTQHLNTIFPLDNGKRVVCLAGAGLADVSRFLETYFPNRESHSTLGSTFLNPTCAAGVALGSGGTQCCRKGSAYTDRAMYVKLYRNKWGELVTDVVNTLGIAGIEDADFYKEGRTTSGSALQQLDIYTRNIKEGYKRSMAKSSSSEYGNAKASDVGYTERLCVNDSTVSRFNADTTRGACDCNRSEGKVFILATVHDTFPKPERQKSFWLSFDSLETCLQFRRQVCLYSPEDAPISLEYMDRDSFDIIDQSGRVMAGLIKLFGTSSPFVKNMWNVKLWIEALPFESAPLACDRFLYAVNNWAPATLPSGIMETGRKMDHHIAMTVGEYGDGNMERLLDRLQSFASTHGEKKIVIHECQSASEAASLTAFRFVAAPAFRTWCVGNGMQGFSVDYALPKNGGTAPLLSYCCQPVKRMRYSHFGCNVVHEDLAFSPEVDAMKAKMELKQTVEHECHGKLPAEHGHGTEYNAPPETQERWKRMDPLNVMNPGIGGLSNKPRYEE
jgi:D-lactate dehydrogenase